MIKIRFGKSEKGGAYEEMKILYQTNREYMHQFELIQSRRAALSYLTSLPLHNCLCKWP